MTDAEQIADRIRSALPNIKSGTLRFWGSWFGRPYDNWHQIVDCDAAREILHVRFNEGELLSVFSPRNASIEAKTFRIEYAHRVRWEWFYYGRNKTPENLYFEEFTRQRDGSVIGETNAGWSLRVTTFDAAVEIL